MFYGQIVFFLAKGLNDIFSCSVPNDIVELSGCF